VGAGRTGPIFNKQQLINNPMKKLVGPLSLLVLVLMTLLPVETALAQSYPAGTTRQYIINLNPVTPQDKYQVAYNMWIGRRGYPVDHKRSVALLLSAAKENHVGAAHGYGVAVYWGLGGLKADQEAGKSWVLRACVLAKVKDTNAALEELTEPNGKTGIKPTSPFHVGTRFRASIPWGSP